MPRQLDHAQRRKEITEAAIRILARGPGSQLTLRSLADELGGSITLVTHFFARREDLFVAIVDDLIDGYDAELAALEQEADDVSRLRALLEWMAPSTKADIVKETGRVALIAHRGEQESVEYFFNAMEKRMRQLLRSHLKPLVPAHELESAVDFLRAAVNGAVLSAVEHPNRWSRRRQARILDRATLAVGVDTSRVVGLGKRSV